MTLLTICQQVTRETGELTPNTIVGNNDENARKLLACAQTEGRLLAKGIIYNANGQIVGQHNWTALRKEYTFNTAASTEGYTLPSDFERFIPDTWWNRTQNRRLCLVDAQRWQFLKSGLSTTSSINQEFIKRGINILISPTPTAIESIYYEYLSKQWCESSGGTDQSAWAADTDNLLLDEDLFIAGLKWRFLRATGAPYADEKYEYEALYTSKIGNDGGRQGVSLGKVNRDYMPNLPEIGYGV